MGDSSVSLFYQELIPNQYPGKIVQGYIASILLQQLEHPFILGGPLRLGRKTLYQHMDEQLVGPLQLASIKAALEGEQGNLRRDAGGAAHLFQQGAGIAEPNPADGTDGKTLSCLCVALNMAGKKPPQINDAGALGEPIETILKRINREAHLFAKHLGILPGKACS